MKSTLLSQAIFATTAALSCTTITMAFTSPSSTTTTRRALPLHATIAAEELNTMSKDDQLKILGVEEEKLALGIDPDEVLEFIGTREDLLTKFQADIPSFSQSEAESEVDKFLMDGEMLDLYIKYSERKREDPNWEPQYAEQDNSPLTQIVNFASQYAIWIVGGILLKDVVSNFMNKNGGGGEADVLVSSALDGIHHLTNNILA